MKALIFDCDGVLVDTERDGHRVAFNMAFAEKGFDFEWSEELYGELLSVAGGKERMRHYFENYGWPLDIDNKDLLIKELHKLKTDLFMQIIDNGELPLRSGIARLVDEAIKEDIKLAVCSTSNEKAVNLIVDRLLGKNRKNHFIGIFAGDIVKRKKPDPEIYNLALKKLNINSNECVVVEDSRNGLLAAKGAGMKCIITTNRYTVNENFIEADLVVDEIGEQDNIKISIDRLKSI